MNEKRDGVSIRERVSKWAAVEPTLVVARDHGAGLAGVPEGGAQAEDDGGEEEQRRLNTAAGW